MMKHPLIIALVALNLVLLGIAVFPSDNGTPIQQVVEKVGSVASPDIQSRYFSVGGVKQWAGHTTALQDATTTVCVLQSPAATSTLLTGALKFTTGATTSQSVTVGKGSTVYTITTQIATTTTTAGETATILAATTSPATTQTLQLQALTNRIFSPSTYLLFQLSDVNAYTDVEGSCNALWLEN